LALAILHQTGLEVETLDTVGALVSRFQLATGPASSGRSVGLASQAGAGPLVAWRDDAALFVAFLSVDGKTHTAPATVPLPDAAAGNVSATFVGDAFLVSTASSRGALASGPVYVIRMLLDGALDGVPKPLLQEVQMRDGYEFYKWPVLASDTTEVRLESLHFNLTGADGGFFVGSAWARLDSIGNLLHGPQDVQSMNGCPSQDCIAETPAPMAVLGTTTALLELSPALAPPSVQVRVVGLDSTGSEVWSHAIAADPDPAFAPRLVRRGQDLIAAWLDLKIRVARITP
jgi:hypothetical protein